ncbi:DUF551 domain-containing protein [Salmonella enterica subsp. enterica]|nr:DUF551 domain-containing protein [Salmonella enterica subsp. enterica serovar Larochelle]ECC9433546.1 DUF551 domain-containing protein [Salmonella enterica subsp. enterica]
MKENQIRELVNELRDIAIEYHGTQQLRERIARTVRAAIIQAGNSPVTQDGWISCSERMPEIRQTVIGWNGYAVRQCVYTRNEYAKTQKGREPRFEILTGIWHGVTHWMQLPEPPQQ